MRCQRLTAVHYVSHLDRVERRQYKDRGPTLQRCLADDVFLMLANRSTQPWDQREPGAADWGDSSPRKRLGWSAAAKAGSALPVMCEATSSATPWLDMMP